MCVWMDALDHLLVVLHRSRRADRVTLALDRLRVLDRPHAAEDPDVALELAHGVVQLPAQRLVLHRRRLHRHDPRLLLRDPIPRRLGRVALRAHRGVQRVVLVLQRGHLLLLRAQLLHLLLRRSAVLLPQRRQLRLRLFHLLQQAGALLRVLLVLFGQVLVLLDELDALGGEGLLLLLRGALLLLHRAELLAERRRGARLLGVLLQCARGALLSGLGLALILGDPRLELAVQVRQLALLLLQRCATCQQHVSNRR